MKLNSAAIGLLLVAILGAEGAAQESTASLAAAENAASAAATAEAQQCFAREPVKTYSAAMRCHNAAETNRLMPLMGSNSDLLAQIFAYRLVLGDALDHKSMTFNEAVFKLRQLQTAMRSEALRRAQQRALLLAAQTQAQRPTVQAQEAAAQNDMAAAGILANGLSNLFRSAPVYTQMPRVTCTSVPIGNSISTNCH